MEPLTFSKEKPARGPGFVLMLAVGWCRIQTALTVAVEGSHGFLMRLLGSLQRLSGALFSQALTIEERSQLTVRIYDFYPGYKDVGNSLYAWEKTWFQRRLRRPPGRILVGACGTGREAVALVKEGFEVDAFEPAPEFVAETRRRLAGRARVGQFTYEDLSGAVLDGAGALDQEFHRERYDAILLGCGSLTHVLDSREQTRLIRALDVLCPSGPILASFFQTDCPAEVPTAGRAVRIGAAIGSRIARLRGIPTEHAPRQSFGQHRGFAHTFTRQEIEDLGRAVNRKVAWEQDDTQAVHATFLPPGALP